MPTPAEPTRMHAQGGDPVT